jgi:hypothetical protein
MRPMTRGLWCGLVIAALAGCGGGNGSGGTGGGTGAGGTTGTGGAGTGSGGSSAKGGSTGTGGAGTFTTSVSSGTKVTALSSSQQTQFCNDLLTFVDDTFVPELCSSVADATGLDAAYFDLLENPAATDAELQAACAQALADAGTSSACANGVDAGAQTCNVGAIPSTCNATVGDYTKCLNDTVSATIGFYASLPACNTLTAAQLNALYSADGGVSTGPSEPTSCSMFDATCGTSVTTGSGGGGIKERLPPFLR